MAAASLGPPNVKPSNSSSIEPSTFTTRRNESAGPIDARANSSCTLAASAPPSSPVIARWLRSVAFEGAGSDPGPTETRTPASRTAPPRRATDHRTTVVLDAADEHVAMDPQREAVPGPQLLDEPGRPLDVGEQIRQAARRGPHARHRWILSAERDDLTPENPAGDRARTC